MSEEEVLEAVPRQIPRWLIFVVGLLVALGAGYLLTRGGPDDTPQPPAGAPPAATSTAIAPPVPFQAGESMHDQLLVYVFQRAHDPDPSQDVIRTGGSNHACVLSSPRVSPRDTLRDVVTAALPSYRVIDEARVIDRFAGLCVLDLRARDPHGTALIVRVTSPIEDATLVSPRLDEGEAVADGTATQFVRVSTHDGWVILAGTSGRPQDAPDRTTLTRLAEQPAARW